MTSATSSATDTAPVGVAAQPVIEVRSLVKAYPDGLRAVDGVDLTVRRGEIVSLVGSNGAGKSTLLRAITRLHEPTEGSVHIGDIDVTAAGRKELRRVRVSVGFIFQRFHLVPRLSAFHNVLHGSMGRRGGRCLWPATSPSTERDEAMACLDRVGLAAFGERRVDTLSGGQQQRVAVARSLMQRPEILLADEPVASLDPVAGIAVMELLRSIADERGLTVVVALHQLDLALRYTDRIVGLRGGVVVLDRPTAGCDATEIDRVYHLVAS